MTINSRKTIRMTDAQPYTHRERILIHIHYTHTYRLQIHKKETAKNPPLTIEMALKWFLFLMEQSFHVNNECSNVEWLVEMVFVVFCRHYPQHFDLRSISFCIFHLNFWPILLRFIHKKRKLFFFSLQTK